MKFWLIKSSGRIIGPYSTPEVTQLIRDRKVSIIDEIRDPNTRWKYIREHANFLDIVRSLRDPAKTAAPNSTPRKPHGDETTDMLNLTVTADIKDPTSGSIQALKNSLANQPQNNSVDSLLDKKNEQRVQAQKYIKTQQLLKKPPHLQKKQNRTSMIALFSVLILGIGAMSYWWMFQRKPKEVKLRPDQYLQIANTKYSLGDYDAAVANFEQAAGGLSLSLEDQVRMGISKLHNNQPTEARKLLESLLPNLRSANLNEQSRFAIAVAKLKEGQIPQATNELNEFAKNQFWREKAQFNLAASLFSQKKHLESIQLFETLVATAPVKHQALLIQSLAHLSLLPTNYDPGMEKTKSLRDLLKLSLERSQDYRAETEVLLARMHLALGDKPAANSFAQEFLDQDPFLSNDHIHDAFLDTSAISWSQIGKECQTVSTQIDVKLSHLFAAYCIALSGDEVMALQKIQELRNVDPRNPSSFGPYALLLLRQNKTDEARAIAKISPFGSLKLPMIIRARVCEVDKDLNCAEESWKKLAEMDPTNIEAIGGLASVYKQKKQSSELKEILERGRVLSPNYRPLREIAMEASGK